MGVLSVCLNMKMLILLVAIGFFVCLFRFFVLFVVLLSSLLVLALLSFNCLLSQSNVQDYGGLFFFKLMCHCASVKS